MTAVAAVVLAAQVVAGIQIQGNTATPDEEVRALAGVSVGMPFDDTLPAAATERLRKAKKFDKVDVLKRYASIEDPSQIMLVIVVDEGPVKIVMTGDPEHPTRVVKKKFPNLLVLPIFRREDGYGITAGARLTLPDKFGKQSLISFPLTWGGTKGAAINIEKRLDSGPFDRVTTGASISRRENLTYGADDDRARVSVRGEREIKHGLRVGVGGGWQRASFEGTADTFAQAGADITIDTRVDPIVPRDAVFVRASFERLAFGDGGVRVFDDPKRYTGYQGSVSRADLDARGYLGLIRQTVLTGRFLRVDSDRPLPPYLQPEIGGLTTVRGYPAGFAAGDTLVTMSAELVVPLNSPLKFGRFGVTAFTDRGKIYNKPLEYSDAPLLVGYGGSVWFAAAFLRINVAVAHGRGSGTRPHVSGIVTF
jgi:outer membrane protein assembly factor BamA